MEFRESNGGMLSGMTRFSDHLDDMPAIGYARANLDHDRVGKYLLLLHGHAANYQSRGAFFSTEQMSLYGEGLFRNGAVGELGADFCTPSQTLVASMTAMQLVATHWDHNEVWLARAAPRRWYGPFDGGFGVENAPTRYGNVSYSVGGRMAGQSTASVSVRVDFSPYPGDVASASSAGQEPPTLLIRIRDLDGTHVISKAGVDPVHATGVRSVSVDVALEVVAVNLTGWTAAFNLSVTFQ